MAKFGSVTSIYGLNFAGRFNPVATITPSASSITEGGSVSFTVASNIISQNISYRVVHGTTTNSDFNPSSSVTGTVTTNSSGGATITLTTVNDLAFSATKNFTVVITFNSVDIATSSSVTINDSASVGFGTIPTSINEGSAGTFNVTSSNLSNGTLIYWRISHGSTVDADFNAISGSFSISTNAGSFTITPTADSLTEGAETFSVILSSTAGGTALTTSSSVTVNDTSVAVTYAFGTIPASINEGSSGTFNVTTTGVPNSTILYWTINHTSTSAADFSATSGSFTITSNAGSFSVTTSADSTTEGNETFTVSIRTGSTTGTIVATSSSVTVNDTSLTPQITAISSAGYNNTYDEDWINFYVTGPDSTGTYSYSVTSVNGFLTVSSVGASATGTFLGIGQVNSVTVHFKSGHSADTARVTITRSGYTSAVVQEIYGARTAKTYTVTPNVTSVNEGGTVNFTISRSDGATASGAIVDWNQTGTATQADFSSPTLWNDRVVLNSSGQATLSFVTVADSTTEGSQTLILELRKGSNVGDLLATSSTVTINDTSTNPPTYAFGIIPASINEGSAGTFNVTTTNVPNSTTLYWTINNTTTAAADFSATSGSFTITSNAGSFTVTPTADSSTEGNETFTVSIRTGSTTGTIVATSSSVTVNDTSLLPSITGTITGVSYINNTDQDQVSFTVTGPVTGAYSYVVDSVGGTLVYDTYTGNPTSGTVTVGGAASASMNIKSSHPADVVRVTISRSGYTNLVLTTSVSARTAKTYSITPNVTSINEGSSVTYTIARSDGAGANGVSTYWENVGTTVAGDFTQNTSGAYINLNTSGQFSLVLTASSDATTEGSENIIVRIRNGGPSGDILATASTVTVNDTSTTPTATYAFGTIPTAINEGSSGTFNVTTTNVANGTILYWTISHTTTTSTDFSPSSGSFTINNNAGSFSVFGADDVTGEADETFRVQIRTGSINGTIVATSASVTLRSFAEEVWVSAGSYTWTVPTGVTSIRILCIGAGGGGGGGWKNATYGTGGGGGGGGGGLSYANAVTVTPGESLNIVVGQGGSGGRVVFSTNVQVSQGTSGGNTYVQRVSNLAELCGAFGGQGGWTQTPTGGSIPINGGVPQYIAAGGARATGTGGGTGGAGGQYPGGGGGGAGGYAGAGGAGANGGAARAGAAGAGGGGGGGASANRSVTVPGFTGVTQGGGAGGGTFREGQGTNGAGGASTSTGAYAWSGSQGSGTDASINTTFTGRPAGGGGGGGDASNTLTTGGSGGTGLVRIIWPSSVTPTRSFPSTNVGKLV